MQVIPILTVTAIAIISVGTAYYFLRDNALDEQVEKAKPSSSSTSNLNVERTPIRNEYSGQPENPAQQQITLLNEKVAALESRLRYVEAAVSEQAENKTDPRPNKSQAPSVSEQEKTKRMSEADFGQWMDESLNTGHINQEATAKVADQAEKSLANVPDITLADMKCEDRFCRATLIPENGKPLNISQVLDAFEFMGSGTTINEPDGSVRIYFTQPGQSLDELRGEAQKTALD